MTKLPPPLAKVYQGELTAAERAHLKRMNLTFDVSKFRGSFHVFRVGDVFSSIGGECVIEAVNESGAIARALTGKLYETKKNVVAETATGDIEIAEKVSRFNAPARPFSVSLTTEPGSIIRHIDNYESASPKRAKGKQAAAAQEQQSNEESNTMKTKAIKKGYAGRNPFIHKLRADGVGKVEAREKTKAKFICGDDDFERVWNGKARGNGGAAKKSVKAKTPPPAKKSKTPPAAKKSTAKKQTPPPVAPPAAPAAPATPATPPPAPATPPPAAPVTA